MMTSEENIAKFFIKILPNKFRTQIKSISSILGKDGTESFNCEARVNLKNEEDFKAWLREHEQLSNLSYRVRKTFPHYGRVVLFKKEYRCQHNTYPKRQCVMPSKKHTNCPGCLVVTIKKVPEAPWSDKEKEQQAYPALVSISYNHNHEIDAVQALRRRGCSNKHKENVSGANWYLQNNEELVAGHVLNHQQIIEVVETTPDVYATSYDENDQAPAEITTDGELVKDCERQLRAVTATILARTRDNPQRFHSAIAAFRKNVDEMCKLTDGELIASLHVLGKISVGKPVRKCTIGKKAAPIPIQPRPQKPAFVVEHGYSASEENFHGVAKKRKIVCVTLSR